MNYVEAITKIANAIVEKRGYACHVHESDVELVMEAIALLVAEWEKTKCKKA